MNAPFRLNNVYVFTTTAGTISLVLGSAVSANFATEADLGVATGALLEYVLRQGSDYEEGIGSYDSSTRTLTRALVIRSRIAGVFATTKITLTGAGATVALTPLAEYLAPAGRGCDVRSTLTTGTARTKADVTAAGHVFVTPVEACWLSLFDSVTWRSHRLSADLDLALDSNSGHSQYHQSGKIFDAWGFINSGNPAVGSGPAWSSDTSRGTGGTTTEIEVVDGAVVNKNAITVRNGSNTYSVAARMGRLLNSFRCTADGQTEDSNAKRFLSNVFNTTSRKLKRTDPAVTFDQDTADGLIQLHATAANKVEFLDCLGDRDVRMEVNMACISRSATQATFLLGIGLDSIAAVSEDIAVYGSATNAAYVAVSARYEGTPGIGYHYLSMLGQVIGANGTWFSNSNHGMLGAIEN